MNCHGLSLPLFPMRNEKTMLQPSSKRTAWANRQPRLVDSLTRDLASFMALIHPSRFSECFVDFGKRMKKVVLCLLCFVRSHVIHYWPPLPMRSYNSNQVPSSFVSLSEQVSEQRLAND